MFFVFAFVLFCLGLFVVVCLVEIYKKKYIKAYIYSFVCTLIERTNPLTIGVVVIKNFQASLVLVLLANESLLYLSYDPVRVGLCLVCT